MSNGKGSEQKADSEKVGAVDPMPSNGNRLAYADGLLSPRMAAEREVIDSVKNAGIAIRDVLMARDVESVAEAMAMKTRATLAMQVLDAANNISAASSGKQTVQLPAAGMQNGSLATLLAQRFAAKRNESRVIQRRVVDAVQPIAAEVTAANSCVDNSAADSVTNSITTDDSDDQSK